MKYRLLVLLWLILIPMCCFASPNNDITKLAEKISESIKTPLYNYDLDTVASVISSLVADDTLTEAVELIDNNTNTSIFLAYKENGTLFPNQKIPPQLLAHLKRQNHSIIYDQEEIGELHLYYREIADIDIILTAEE